MSHTRHKSMYDLFKRIYFHVNHLLGVGVVLLCYNIWMQCEIRSEELEIICRNEDTVMAYDTLQNRRTLTHNCNSLEGWIACIPRIDRLTSAKLTTIEQQFPRMQNAAGTLSIIQLASPSRSALQCYTRMTNYHTKQQSPNISLLSVLHM